MNQYQLNGNLLGNGTPDPRVFLSVSETGRATSTVSIYALRSLVVAATPSATSVTRLDGVFQMAASVIARVTSSITSSTYYAKYLSAGVTAGASSSGSMQAFKYLSASVTSGASGVVEAWRGRLLEDSVTCAATSTAGISEFGGPAADERQMILSREDRKMKVV